MLSLFRVFALFPLGLLQVMGWLLGWLAFLASPSYRRRFQANADLAGVDVLLVVPEASDHRTVDAAARSYVPALLKAGARVLRLGRRRLHAKVLVVDDDFASVGTLNMDNRSFRLNFEVTASLFDRTVVESVAARVSAVAADSSAVVHPRDDERWTERFAQSGARLLSPLL